MKFTFRWYGEQDPITLDMIRQIPAVDGIVSAVYNVPVGEIWPIAAIQNLKNQIRSHGLEFKVIESVPVHEDIKAGLPTRDKFIENYCQTLYHLNDCGIDTVTYNFMPIFDWMRTDLKYVLSDGSKVLRFDQKTLEKYDLSKTDLRLPGWDTSYSQDELQSLLSLFHNISEDALRENLFYFLSKVIPVAEECGIKMAIHPDDPPWSIFNLPRVIKNAQDISVLFEAIPSPYNGLALCSGSFGADPMTDIPTIIRSFSDRIHFAHVRNINITGVKQFHETAHMTKSGSLNIKEIMKAYRYINYKGPLRPDHGRMIWDEKGKPGYGLYDRALGIMYLRGLWEGLS